jgi:hypothetical protein
MPQFQGEKDRPSSRDSPFIGDNLRSSHLKSLLVETPANGENWRQWTTDSLTKRYSLAYLQSGMAGRSPHSALEHRHRLLLTPSLRLFTGRAQSISSLTGQLRHPVFRKASSAALKRWPVTITCCVLTSSWRPEGVHEIYKVVREKD